MSIRPVDMQIVVHKTQDIHPAKQSVINKQDHELVHAQQENKLNSARDNKRILKTERSELKKVKNDKEGSSQKKQNKKKKNGDEASTQSDQLNPCGSRFDMKV